RPGAAAPRPPAAEAAEALQPGDALRDARRRARDGGRRAPAGRRRSAALRCRARRQPPRLGPRGDARLSRRVRVPDNAWDARHGRGERLLHAPRQPARLLAHEAAEHARARGAGIHGEITGFAGSAGEGRLASEDEPTRLASRLARVIERAIDEAGGGPDVVSLHGDGIPAHDSAEARALTRVLGARAETTPRLRMKQAHADLGAAASPVELL